MNQISVYESESSPAAQPSHNHPVPQESTQQQVPLNLTESLAHRVSHKSTQRNEFDRMAPPSGFSLSDDDQPISSNAETNSTKRRRNSNQGNNLLSNGPIQYFERLNDDRNPEEELYKQEIGLKDKFNALPKSTATTSCRVARISSSPSLVSFAANQEASLAARQQEAFSQSSSSFFLNPLPPSSPMPKSPSLKKVRRGSLTLSVSAPNLENLASVVGPASASQRSSPVSDEVLVGSYANTNPDHLLYSLLQSQGCTAQARSSLDLEGFFIETTPEHIAGYGTDIINAVRSNDVDTLSDMYHDGKTLQCCNKFGESIVHMACRRSSIQVVEFLKECGVSMRVCDDYGRTPLHDACWTQEPQMDLVKLLLEICPDFLLCKDKRGFSPLSYVRRDHWGTWCRFLESHKELLLPREFH